MRKNLVLAAMIVVCLTLTAQAQTPSCIAVSLNGEPIIAYDQSNPGSTSPCLNYYPTQQSRYFTGDISVYFSSTVPITAVLIGTVNSSNCDFYGTSPSNLNVFNGQTTGTFTLNFAQNSGRDNLTGTCEVNMLITDANGTQVGATASTYCRPPNGWRGGSGDEPPPSFYSSLGGKFRAVGFDDAFAISQYAQLNTLSLRTRSQKKNAQ